MDVNLRENNTEIFSTLRLRVTLTTQMVTQLHNSSYLRHITAGRCHYLLSSEGDHVQRAVHETPRHHLGSVLRVHRVVHSMVGRHILTHRGQNRKSDERPPHLSCCITLTVIVLINPLKSIQTASSNCEAARIQIIEVLS